MSVSYKKVLLSMFLAAVLLFSFSMPAESVSAASKTKKMTLYSCIKSGDTVYCTNANHIFTVDLKTKKVKVLAGSKSGYPGDLKLKGNYLYYRVSSQGYDKKGYGRYLYRVNVKTKTKQKLGGIDDFVIKGSKVYTYARRLIGDKFKINKLVMKLNGKSKKKTSIKAKNKLKKTNAPGYYVTDDIDWGNAFARPAKYYLRTPDGRILLEKLPNPVI